MCGYVVNFVVFIGYWWFVGVFYGGFFFDSFVDEMVYVVDCDLFEFWFEFVWCEYVFSVIVL